ncbi:hypothetical protein SAMN05518865_101608 [Duganella sp. CF458]|uniref:hypothetical protein n=1 Tax=Duganella sp. CF458 TaxID=1884368 RepID=UPI0008E4F42B|nr:hypothetical protein [Duganella sp. CF458]SFF56978.1 hypothetical protein SAMN05518865_101608 [Duganella sp. CF458]
MDQRIIPGLRADNWTLGMSEDDIRAAFDYTPTRQRTCLKYEQVDFFLGKGQELLFMHLHGDYDGTFRGIGIGSTLADVQTKLGRPYFSEDGVFSVEGFPGISFLLSPRKMSNFYGLDDEPGDPENLYGYALKDLTIERLVISSGS